MERGKRKLSAVKRCLKTGARWRVCQPEQVKLQTGECLKRGCGKRGLYPFDGGWRCFYCGRYLYETGSPLRALWFHFRLAREYWRIQCANGRDFINGIPVPGVPDPLPHRLQRDLSDPEPPAWFSVFVEVDEEGFKHFLKQNYIH
ncbi:MAG: hypothetical protein G3M70_06065 [Candidatus Nitronauta litoralis]|uniref:Uncharacterized protein n=1 Tax=Candidatus Nitronauta litoralis TaxID=2705533 RepID=A0A7T0FZE9_9BACT|nr:MAG: hypothetical protein G3M70_06065 [Candidatus Nitronauta litoralis]